MPGLTGDYAVANKAASHTCKPYKLIQSCKPYQKRKSIGQQRNSCRSRYRTVKANSGASELRELGSSGLKVPACCLGTMTWGSQNTEEDAHEQLSYALDQGINFFDTAEMYPVPVKKEYAGATDKCIGSWLKNVQRDKIILATKVVGYGNKWIRGNEVTSRVTKKHIEQSVDASLKRLGTDYVDLLQVHWPDRYVGLFGQAYYDPSKARWDEDEPFEAQMEGLASVVKAGKVRHIGVSNETSYGVMKLNQAAREHGLPCLVSIQNNYSLLVRVHFDVNLGEVCHKNNENVGLLAYSPLAGGVLSGKYIDGAADKKSRLNLFEGYMARYNSSPARQVVGEYVKIAKKHGMTPSELALAWCNQRWTVTSTIIGATKMDQLKRIRVIEWRGTKVGIIGQENIAAFDIKLSEEVLKEIDVVHASARDPSSSPLQ